MKKSLSKLLKESKIRQNKKDAKSIKEWEKSKLDRGAEASIIFCAMRSKLNRIGFDIDIVSKFDKYFEADDQIELVAITYDPMRMEWPL